MMRFLIPAIFFLLSALRFTATAQQLISLAPERSLSTVNNRKVVVMDKRADTSAAIGSMIFDYEKGPEVFRTKRPLSEDLSLLLAATPRSGTKDVVVLVYRFLLTGNPARTRSAKEYGSFRYTADFFVADSGYALRYAGSVDTEALVAGYEVSTLLYRSMHEILSASFAQFAGSTVIADTRPFHLPELNSFTTEWRNATAPFTGDLPSDACYDQWEDFLALKNSGTISAEIRASQNGVVFYRQLPDQQKKRIALPSGKVFIYGGQAYYRMQHSYRKMVRRDGDFWVNAPVYVLKKGPSVDQLIGYTFMFGLVGAVAAVNSNSYAMEYYECKVNPRGGSLIPVRKLADKADKDHYLRIL